MRMIAAVVLSIVLLGSVAPVQAEEDWRTHAIGRGGLTIRLPAAWTVLVDELEGRLKATEPRRARRPAHGVRDRGRRGGLAGGHPG